VEQVQSPKDIDYVEKAAQVALNVIRDLFRRNRYPRTVQLTQRPVEKSNTSEIYIIEMKKERMWIRYELKVQAYPPTTAHYPDYNVYVSVALINTYDLYVRRSDIALKSKEFTCRQSMIGYFARSNLAETLLYWQALIQMKWVDVSLFTLMRHRVKRLIKKLRMFS